MCANRRRRTEHVAHSCSLTVRLVWPGKEKPQPYRTRLRYLLLKEAGVGTIGGIQGDYEFIEFSRDRLHEALVRLLQVFDVFARGLRA